MASATISVRVRNKAQVTLPPAVREALGVREGDQLEFEINEDGSVEVHGTRTIRTDQAYFWTDAWQAGERESDADIAAGRTTAHEDEDAFLAHLSDMKND
ncbi:AbrB/MazE/SpoVT family DNA-binding domain-containing protein [Streptomyces meridianus]|uniref:AbrB/MazE/SpoVT family DNA-binding domain-containing protein n=1 Tax=Streptomyces meridianus TaxID=2938945 RepID=A0ABT0X4Y6_9ACTN|nr:AbrB/MazE/SpoVT family DNA-binding domain-containing protein [Streptomyces meridianus]MCM2576844.1 AbrB/MazE/SpoVT family DNA-binding domain-containing protein [Streptomyces meridianus]